MADVRVSNLAFDWGDAALLVSNGLRREARTCSSVKKDGKGVEASRHDVLRAR